MHLVDEDQSFGTGLLIRLTLLLYQILGVFISEWRSKAFRILLVTNAAFGILATSV